MKKINLKGLADAISENELKNIKGGYGGGTGGAIAYQYRCTCTVTKPGHYSVWTGYYIPSSIPAVVAENCITGSCALI